MEFLRLSYGRVALGIPHISTRAFYIKTAFGVITYISCSSLEEVFSQGRSIFLGYIGYQLFYGMSLGKKYFSFGECQSVTNTSIHPPERIIQSGMYRIDSNMMLYSLDDCTFYIVAPCEPLKPTEDDGVKAYNKITISRYCLLNHCF